MERTTSERFPLRRREVARRLLADPGDLLVVAGLGSTPGTSPSPGTGR